MKRIRIYDYSGDPTIVELKDSPILLMTMKEVTGDEVLVVRYEDGSRQVFDSSNCRTMSFYDGEYDIIGEDIEKFLKDREVKDED